MLSDFAHFWPTTRASSAQYHLPTIRSSSLSKLSRSLRRSKIARTVSKNRTFAIGVDVEACLLCSAFWWRNGWLDQPTVGWTDQRLDRARFYGGRCLTRTLSEEQYKRSVHQPRPKLFCVLVRLVGWSVGSPVADSCNHYAFAV